MKYILLLIILLGFTFSAWSQGTPLPGDGRKPGELIVRIADDADIQKIVVQLQQSDRRAASLFLKKTVAASWHIYLLGFDEDVIGADELRSTALHTAEIRSAAYNYTVQERGEPNDPKWPQQLDMSLISAAEAWSTSTGGLTPNGDTIVVAVLEKGALLDHPDLIDNIWYNRREIPNNDIDDDQNGYVDDYRGYDIRNGGSGTGNTGSHGTAVNGIIGATGNNGLGIAGVNWKVKLMNISNVSADDEVVSAYEYVANMRKRYNDTQGQEGAFVVATNASFGIDNGLAAQYPDWCNAYDSLGVAGVLSVGATTNKDLDVDAAGDIPSTCPSEYLLVVTNVTASSGAKVPATGYGKISVDLGAPGEGVFTTLNNNDNPTYGGFTGTSAATPHVSGAIGLLYSLDCAPLTNDALTQPAACARRVRDILLHNVVPEPTLSNITTAGGRLDLQQCVIGVQALCESSVGPLHFLTTKHFADNSWEIYFQTPTLLPYSFRVFNMLGQLMYEQTVQPEQFSASFINFETANWPRGVYVMTLGRAKNIIARNFIKI